MAALRCNGDARANIKETMITKGVASVRSPVQNLQLFRSSITHEMFVQAMVRAFQDAYDVEEEARYIVDTESVLSPLDIKKGMEELQSWDWLYGQTPEFTYSISRLFDFGLAKAEITSKHGVILNCNVECHGLYPETLELLNKTMIDMRYGFIKAFEKTDLGKHSLHSEFGESFDNSLRIREIWNWIREESSS